jgi:hypothetical protein
MNGGQINRSYLCRVILPLVIFAGTISEPGCGNSTNKTGRKIPAINEYIKGSKSLFHDLRLYELRMNAVPSPEGGEIVVSGYVESQTTYDLLIRIFSNPAPTSPPAKIVWKAKVDPVRAPCHHVY